MAELDDKLLKNLDATLQRMNTHLQNLEQTLAGVKGSMNAAFDPSILTEWTNAMRGMKAARIVDAESLKGVEEIKTVFNDISILRKEISQGKGFRLFSESELNQARTQLAEIQDIIALLNNMSKAGKLVDSDYAYLGELRAQRDILKQQLAMGGAFDVTLNEEDMRRKIELLARYKEERENLLKGEQQRGVELANIKKKEEQAEETALRKAMANVKRQIDAKTQLTRIEHEREERARAGSKLTQQQIDAENRKYQALEETIQRLAQQGYQQFGSAVMGQAYLNNKPYEFYSQAKEDQRHLAQLQKIEEQQKKNTQETKKQEKALRDVEMTAERLKNALVAAFGIQQIKRFASEILKVRGEFEMSEVALTNIIGNAEKAQTIWKKTMNLAINSPLSAMQLTRYTKQLAAFRVETDKLYDTTKMLGDVAVGLGVDMERLILAYGHTKSSGFLRGMYARQFATAGVNIYGELAKYYTEVEGSLVTFRDVYERISKKLVSFADVEKVFEKITAKGGTFYNMQQLLSDTVQGQINKIKDSWQQALNDMGKSTQGTIRGITNIVLNLVKNWRTWLSVIEGVTAAFIAFKAINIGRALLSVSYAANAASKSTLVLAGALKSVFTNFKGNLPSLVSGLAIAAITVFATMKKHMDDYNREIDEQSITLYEAQQKMHDYQKRVEANNVVIKDSSSSEEQLKFARQDNLDVLAQLEQEYPEMYSKEMLLKDGEVELTEKIEAHNKSLKEQIRLNEELKQSSIFDDPFEKDTRQYFEQLNEWRKRIIKTQKELELQMAHEQLNIDEEPMVKALLDIDTNDILAAIAKYNEIIDSVQKKLHEVAEANRKEQERIQGYSDETAWWRALEETGLSHVARFSMIDTNVHAVREFSDESEAMVKEMLDGFELTVRGIESEQILIKEKYDKAIEDYMRESGIQTIEEIDAETKEILSRKAFSDYFRENSERLLEMVKTNTIDVNETIRTFLEAHGQALTDENKQVWNTILNDAINGSEQITKILSLAEQSWTEKSPFLKRFLLNQADKLRGKQYDFFAAYKSPTKEDGDDDGSGKTYKSLDELLNLLKTMNSEYNKLSKSAYGFVKSNEMVMKVFRESFKDIFKTTKGLNQLDDVLTMIKFDTVDITSKQGLANAFQELYDFLEKNSLWNQFGKDADKLRAKLQKTIDMQEVEVGMDVQVRIRDDFGKKMEKAFNDYELTLELDKLNLPKGLAADMWGIEETDLQDLRKRLSQMYMGLRDENGQLSDEAFKDYEKFLNKIDDLERKQQRERLKDYAKYLEAQYSDRVKLEMDYVRRLAQLESETAIPEQQKSDIRKGLEREFLEKSRKQDWEDFKGSEFYVGMMEDLEKQGSASLEVMRKKLLEMRENAENLSPRALKEVVNALEKIDELEKKRIPPLKRIREEQEKLRGIEIKDVYERIAANQEKLAQDEQEQKDLERMIMLEEERQKLEKQGITLEEAKARLARSEQALSLILPSLDIRSDGTKEGEERRRILTETVNQAKKEVETWAEIVRILSGQAVIDEQERGSKYKGLSLSDLKKRRDDAKQRIKDLEGVIGKDEELVKAQKDLEDAWNDTWEAAKRWAQSINGIFDGVMDTVGYFSDSTSTLTDGWKEFGDTSISALTDLVSGIQAYQQANAAAKKAGLATGLFTANGLQLAMVILGVIIKIVQAIAKMHDARIDKEIEQSKKKVDDLQKAYDRLEKSIEKTFDTVSYIREYNQEVQNLNEQIEEANRQIAAAQDYKSEDKRKEVIEAAEDAKQQALDSLEEIKQAQIEVFGGIGRDSYRSAAEGFVDAWKSAFLETGDGLQGLQDHFDEFLNDWFVKQATMRYAAAALEPVFKMIDDAVDPYGAGGANVVMQKLEAIKEWARVNFPQISDTLEEISRPFIGEGEGSLSGLAAGIQGMTEEQANILEAYWSTVMGNTINIDRNVSRIVDMMIANYGGGRSVESNPMLQQLNLIAANTAATHTILQSVTKSGHTMGGSGIKVFVD